MIKLISSKKLQKIIPKVFILFFLFNSALSIEAETLIRDEQNKKYPYDKLEVLNQREFLELDAPKTLIIKIQDIKNYIEKNNPEIKALLSNIKQYEYNMNSKYAERNPSLSLSNRYKRKIRMEFYQSIKTSKNPNCQKRVKKSKACI